jgi:hypothetical protein
MVGMASRNVSQGTRSLLHGFSLGHDSSRPCHRCADGRFRSDGCRLNRLDIFRGKTSARRRSLITGPARARSGHDRGTVSGTLAARSRHRTYVELEACLATQSSEKGPSQARTTGEVVPGGRGVDGWWLRPHSVGVPKTRGVVMCDAGNAASQRPGTLWQRFWSARERSGNASPTE